MVRSKDGVLITREEYEMIEKRMKEAAEVVIKGTTMASKNIVDDLAVGEMLDGLLPIMGELQTNAANLAFAMVKKELFEV